MVEAFQAVLFLHVLGAALWFGAGLGLGRRLAKGVAEGGAVLAAAVDDARRMRVLALVGALVTIASGLGLVFLNGGFKALPVRFHLGIGLAFVALALELGLVSRAVRALGNGEARALKQVRAGSGIVHLLWGVTLGLMVWRF